MFTWKLSSLMRTIAKRDEVASPQCHDRPVKTEWPDRADPRGAYAGYFILGYGKVPGTRESAKGLF